MISLFKSAQPQALLFLLVFALLVGAMAFLGGEPELATSEDALPVVSLFPMLFSATWLSRIVAVVLLLAQALYLNFLCDQYGLLSKKSYLAAFFFLLLSASFPGNLLTTPALLANLFLLPAIHLLLRLAAESRVTSLLFGFGLLTGLASLIDPASLALFPLVGVALVYFRSFNLREWLLPIAGWLTPMIYLSVWWFLYDQFEDGWSAFAYSFPDLSIRLGGSAGPQWGFTTILLVAFVLALPHFLRTVGINKVRQRQSLVLFVWVMLLGLAGQLLVGGITPSIMVPVAIGMGLYFSIYALQTRRTWLVEPLFLMLLLAVVFNMFIGEL